MILSRHIRVTGKVQGVFFRRFISEKAKEIGGLSGFVKNENDGSVYIEAQGEREKIKDLVIACHVGNGKAEVSNVNVHRAEVCEAEGFEVR